VSIRYLLDTNIVSDLIRNPQGKVTTRIVDVGEAAVATSIIVSSELRFGATKRGSARLSSQLEEILAVLPILPLEKPADASYGQLRAALESAGTPIGANDMLIAAQALSLDMTIVTDNVREFVQVPGLRVENWLL
jgi:tRNA(fMet)-specific endonuclease VapC